MRRSSACPPPLRGGQAAVRYTWEYDGQPWRIEEAKAGPLVVPPTGKPFPADEFWLRVGLLHTAAAALLGEWWQRPLAREAQVDRRLLRRWAKGERPVPVWILQRLRRGLEARRQGLAALIAALPAGEPERAARGSRP